jgi:hypothetical protein
LSVNSFDNAIFEDIFEEKQTQENQIQDDKSISLQDVKAMGVELVDITNSNVFDVTNQKKSETLKSGSSCSSRTSHTNDNDLSELDSQE